LKTLSVRQPWAHFIMTGAKTIENRTWQHSHRGPLLIHAGVSRAGLCGTAAWPCTYRVSYPDEAALAFGCVLGVVDLVDIGPLEKVRHDPWAEGPWCWLLENPRRLAAPVPLRGLVKLFESDLDLPLPGICKRGETDGNSE
jgi:hypothetical protein